MVYE